MNLSFHVGEPGSEIREKYPDGHWVAKSEGDGLDVFLAVGRDPLSAVCMLVEEMERRPVIETVPEPPKPVTCGHAFHTDCGWRPTDEYAEAERALTRERDPGWATASGEHRPYGHEFGMGV